MADSKHGAINCDLIYLLWLENDLDAKHIFFLLACVLTSMLKLNLFGKYCFDEQGRDQLKI